MNEEENEKLLFDSFISHFQNLYLEEQVIWFLNFEIVDWLIDWYLCENEMI